MMPKRSFKFRGGKTGAALSVRITPRAKTNEIVEILDDQTVKIKLTAPPVDGKANAALISFLSDVLDISASRIEIVAGEKGRNKIVSILDMDTDSIQAILHAIN